ncbi:MAG: PEP-utilizing enzyme [Candidatus Buchananbacteria bacterium]
MKQHKLKWDIDEVEAVYWICPEAAKAMTVGMRKIYGFGFNRNVVIFEGNKPFKWCTLTIELEYLGNQCYLKFKNKLFRQKIDKYYSELKKKIDQAIILYQKKSLASFSNSQLFDQLELFTNYYRLNFSVGFFAEPFDLIFPKVFNDIFKKYHLTQEESSDLLAIYQPSYINLEWQDLIILAEKFKQGKDIKSLLSRHIKKYEWLATGHCGKQNIGKEYFMKRIKQLISEHKDLNSELKHLKDLQSKIKNKKKIIVVKYKFNQKALDLIDLINQVGPWHDLRKELFVKTIFYADELREEIGCRFGYSLKQLQLFTVDELSVLAMNKKLDSGEIKRRQEFIFLDVDFKKNKLKIFSGKAYKKLVTEEFEEKISQSHEVFGSVASSGKASGKVKVIYGTRGFEKMKLGDILVTGMTRPEMMPIMKKAKAIVTDEGGMTCHAAIVARELKIPCVIGTKVATKIFKDGDVIEVDAIKGVVKKI